QVFFGDATRSDLLESAGCKHARLFVLAIEDPTRALLVAHTVAEHFPDLPMIARAYDVRHAHTLRGAGVAHTVCAASGGGMELGREVLLALGFDPYRAERAMHRFQRHESETQAMLFHALDDDGKSLEIARQRTADLDRLLEVDSETLSDDGPDADAAWATDSLAASVRAGRGI
ncbi:MAG: NAD-binding protein, partial [Planctomycetota bacterium]